MTDSPGATGANALTGSLAVSVNNLSHSFKRSDSSRQIISNLSLTLTKGESVAVVGRSGSGKSTLLNILGGLEPVQQGDITLFDQSMNALNDHQRTALRRTDIGFIYQSFNLIPTLTVADNVNLPLALNTVPYGERQQRLNTVLEAIGLTGREQDFPDALSGGEQQRVAIARAVIHQPALVLADEPTGNLDADTGRTVLQLLFRLVREQRTTLLLVTHSMEVARLADRVLVMQDGKLHAANFDDGSFAW